MHTLTTIALTAVAVLVSSAPAVDLDRQAIAQKHLQPAIDALLIPGAVVGIDYDGITTFHIVGTLNYDTDTKPTTGTMYEIGSISKLITGTLLADAIGRGEVTKDTPLNDLLPEGVQAHDGPGGEPIRLWHLTTHTSGWGTMPINLVVTNPDLPFAGYTIDMLMTGIEKTPVMHTPGTHFEYSNFAVGVLGSVLALHAGSDYETLSKERILSPLDIDDFTITLGDEQRRRLAPATRDGMDTLPWGTMGALAPAGMWTATAPALMAFAKANLRAPSENEAGHQADIYTAMELARQPLFSIKEMGQQVCMGWFIAGDGQSRWHNGMTGGYSSYLGINRDLGIAIVVLTNGASLYTTAAGEKIFQEVAGMHPDPIAPPIPHKLNDEETTKLVGTYRSQLGFDIDITTTHGLIYARLTRQPANRLHPVKEAKPGEKRFRYDGIDAELGFAMGEGKASAVTLYQNGMEMRCERVGD